MVRIIFEKILSKIKNIKKRLFPEYDLKKIGKIGKDCIIGPNSILKLENLFLEDYVIIQNNVNFITNKGRLFVGKYSVVSSGCTIIPGKHVLKVGLPFYFNTLYHIGDIDKDIIIEEDCWIGANSILMPGVRIRRGAIIGAGAVITKDVQPYSVVAGCPAKIVATRLTAEQVREHEESIYEKKDRLSTEYIKQVFVSYDGLKSISEPMTSIEEIKDLLEKFPPEIRFGNIPH